MDCRPHSKCWYISYGVWNTFVATEFGVRTHPGALHMMVVVVVVVVVVVSAGVLVVVVVIVVIVVFW